MKPASSVFISCDWGTSSFRMRLVDVVSLAIHAQVESEEGIAATYRSWQASETLPRKDYYGTVLRNHLEQLEKKAATTLSHLPMVVSGMASASIGMVELPYGTLPFNRQGKGLVVESLSLEPLLPNRVLLVSGVSSGSDVMRGEETQLLGLMQDTSHAGTELVIIPGTHSKHVSIAACNVAGFATYMTGEFFQLLSQQSILAASVVPGGNWQAEACQLRFLEGVTQGSRLNLLLASFGVRINQLLRGIDKVENFHFLSGLLIGAELRDLKQSNSQAVCLLGNEDQCARYNMALSHLYPQLPVRCMPADAALVKGQATLFRQAFIV